MGADEAAIAGTVRIMAGIDARREIESFLAAPFDRDEALKTIEIRFMGR